MLNVKGGGGGGGKREGRKMKSVNFTESCKHVFRAENVYERGRRIMKSTRSASS